MLPFPITFIALDSLNWPIALSKYVRRLPFLGVILTVCQENGIIIEEDIKQKYYRLDKILKDLGTGNLVLAIE